MQELQQEEPVPLVEPVLAAKVLRRQEPWPELVLVVKMHRRLGLAPAVKVIRWLELVSGLLQLEMMLAVMLQGLVLDLVELVMVRQLLLDLAASVMVQELLLDLAASVMALIPPLVATELLARAHYQEKRLADWRRLLLELAYHSPQPDMTEAQNCLEKYSRVLRECLKLPAQRSPEIRDHCQKNPLRQGHVI